MPRAEHSYKRAILDGLKVEYSKASSPLQKAEEVAALLETGGADVTIALAPGGHELGEDAFSQPNSGWLDTLLRAPLECLPRAGELELEESDAGV